MIYKVKIKGIRKAVNKKVVLEFVSIADDESKSIQNIENEFDLSGLEIYERSSVLHVNQNAFFVTSYRDE